MIPGFLTLIQDDQISLLKDGTYGVMLLYLTQSYVPEKNAFLYNNSLISVDLFIRGSQCLDENEKYFIQDNIDLIRQLKQLNLSDSELALISAIILFNADNKDLNDQKLIYQFNQRFIEILRLDIDNNRNDQQLLQQILSLLNRFVRPLTRTHFELLTNFKLKYPLIEFPPLHKELFNVEYFIFYNHHQHQQQQQQQIVPNVNNNNENSSSPPTTTPTQIYHQQQHQLQQYHHQQQQIPYFSNQQQQYTNNGTNYNSNVQYNNNNNNNTKQQIPPQTYQIYIQPQAQQQTPIPQQQYTYLNASPQNLDINYPTVSSSSSTASSSSSSSSPTSSSPTSTSYSIVPSSSSNVSYTSLIKTESSSLFNTNNMPIGIDTA